MRIKLTLRDKIKGTLYNEIVTADSPEDAKDEAESSTIQVLATKVLGQEEPKPVKPAYVSIKKLRARHERDLCNKQMKVGKYSPEAIAAQRIKEQLENAKELADELEM